MPAGKTARLWRRLLVGGIIAVGATVLVYFQSRPADDTAVSNHPLTVAGILGGKNDTNGYARADGPRQFSFPDDHGPHRRFKHEWWYFTGNVSDQSGRRFGYQLTIFRIALSPRPRRGESAWGTNQLYMAHFALTDADNHTFHAFQRFERGALGLAGAAAHPFHVWLDDWSVTAAEPGRPFPVRLRAAQDGYEVDLVLQGGKPVVLEGDHGLSRKSSAPGNASYYYSLTRMPTLGTVRIKDRIFHVQGASWMDREWSSSALAGDQAGWDWFAVQLSDDSELMFYRLRNSDGDIDPHSSGTQIFPDGRSRHLTASDVKITVLDEWQSPHSGARYPTAWHIEIPGQDLSLHVTPLLKDQELNLAVTYWEGAVKIAGTSHKRPLTGFGYVELTGYSGRGR